MDLEFHIMDVVEVLHLPYPDKPEKTSYYIPCPCCEDKPGGKHLNINILKDVYRCPRCNTKGGVYDLYSLYTNVPKDKVRQALREKLGRNSSYKPQRKTPILPERENQECPLIGVEERNATYTALLNKLTLANDHKQNLLNRGLTETEIEKLGYKTTPIMGMSSIARNLQLEGVYLAGVPGFYRLNNEAWTFVSEKRGILIPVRDIEGRIQGMQIRLDNVEKRKFRWFSSTDRKDGCQASGCPHLAGPIREKIILTEGVMKADIIHALTGRTVIAVPGVHSIAKLKGALERLKELGLREVKTAFDMDFIVNPNVQEALGNIRALLSELGLKNSTYIWDSQYKGLDDYIWEYKMKKKRE